MTNSIDYLLTVKDQLSPILRDINRQLEDIEKVAEKSFNKTFGTIKNNFSKATSSIRDIGVNIKNTGKEFLNILDPAIKFEASFAEVKKYIEGTPKEIEDLRQGILGMAAVLPGTVDDLAKIAAMGGKMGLGRELLKDYTDVVSNLALAFELTAEDAGTSIARLAANLKMPATKEGLLELGGMINELSNNMKATASGILNSAVKSSTAFEILGNSKEMILAMTSTLQDLGLTTGMSATALSKLGSSLSNVAANKTRYEAFLKTGFTKKSWEQLVNMQGGDKAIMTLLERISKLDKWEREGVLKGLFAENSKYLNKLTSNIPLLKKALDLVNDKTKVMNSVNKEASIRMATVEEKLNNFQDAIQKIKINIGSSFLPVAGDLIGSLTVIADKFGVLAANNPLIGQLVMLMPVLTSFSNMINPVIILSKSLFGLGRGLGGLIFIIGKYIFSVKTLLILQKAWNAIMIIFNLILSMNPVVLIILGIIALSAAIAGLIIYWDKVSEAVGNFFKKLWDYLPDFSKWGDKIKNIWKKLPFVGDKNSLEADINTEEQITMVREAQQSKIQSDINLNMGIRADKGYTAFPINYTSNGSSNINFALGG